MLQDLLAQYQDKILHKWNTLVVESYPLDSQKFLFSQSDPFRNPVGAAITRGTVALYEGLRKGMDPGSAESAAMLDEIIRIRAVQDFTPAQAIEFIPRLKVVIRDVVGREIRENNLYEEFLAFGEKIDRMALLAFNIYMQCREKVYELRATELRNRTTRILEVACRKYGSPESWTDSEEK
jgi:hypothetical protein